MRYSKLFGKTRHDAPCDANSVNAKLLAQAGFVEKLSAGVYNLLPLGLRVLGKIASIIREEMDVIGGQELLLPALSPIDNWKKTGRDRTLDDILYRTHASGDKEFVFGPSHEEIVTPLVAKYIQSYKELPLSVYQIQTKFRDEPRAKSGLLRGREFGMKDMYSFHLTEEDLDDYYEKAKVAYARVYERCGLEALVIEASGGAFTDKFSHEFSVITPVGEDTIITCKKCGTAQNLDIAEGKVVDPEADEEEELAMEEVEIKRGFSVDENAKAHGVGPFKILKSVVYEVEDGGLFAVVIRGDLNVSELKLEKYLGKRLRPATPEALKEAGLVRGYISPVNIPDEIDISFVGDHSIKNVKNFVTGANADGLDLKNVNIGRDFVVKDFTDLVEVKSGFECHKCGDALEESRAIEVGNIFKLGTIYSEAFGLSVTDKDGKLKPVVMGCYGIGTTRLIGSLVEVHHDENGIIWPKNVAPYHVHMMSLGNDDEVLAKSDELYDELKSHGVEVLYDDRDERAGVKLKDADLIGIPLRIVVSRKTLEKDSVEWKVRGENDAEIISLDHLLAKISAFLD